MEEAGRNLSVGQKQRIALARAVVRNPSVLVLDEATSALDSDAERQIFAQLEPWLRQRTALVMAHRLSTISRFERVIVLDRGVVVGDGTVAGLAESCPVFAQLFGDQLEARATPRAAAAVG
jgi:ABC-type bacteriocin/lantibiotic exporter with double-glycine peptidase domain